MTTTCLVAVKAYLGASASRYTDDVLLGVIATEQAAQMRRCRISWTLNPTMGTDPLLADVEEALLRRVQRNLAMRALPLGLTDASGDGSTSSFIPGNDPEVRRLEAPYRRFQVG